jgi:hypothetical protein
LKKKKEEISQGVKKCFCSFYNRSGLAESHKKSFYIVEKIIIFDSINCLEI